MEQDKILNEVVEAVEKEFDVEAAVVRQENTIKANRNNEELVGISVKTKGSNMAAILWIKEMADVETMKAELIDFIKKMPETPSIDVDFLLDWDKCRDRVEMVIYNAERNKSLMEKVPYRPFLDLIITYQVNVEVGDGEGSVKVTNQLLKSWGITEDELNNAAYVNLLHKDWEVDDMIELMKKAFEESCPGLSDIFMKEIIEQRIDSGTHEYVVTSKSKVRGAAGIMSPIIQERLEKLLGDEFYIIPSSIHETICCSKAAIDAGSASSMIKQVNPEELPEEDFLSDSLYKYTKGKGIEIAEV